MVKIKGNNQHGNNNEHNIVRMLNGKRYKELNINLKKFIEYICKNKKIAIDDSTIVNAKFEKNSKLKQDFYIEIKDQCFGISLKMGLGNSTHQEKIEDFIEYLKKEFNASEELCNDWKFFAWADGTTDGTGDVTKNADGKIITRFTGAEFKKKFPEKRANLQNFLNQYEKDLIERFLFLGRHGSQVDFLYHGTALDGTWISKEKIINFLLGNSLKLKNNKTLSIGRMSVQVWNVSRSGNTEKKRGQIQIKYSTMKSDMNIIMKEECTNIGSFEGDRGEFDLTKILNKDKNKSFWKDMFPEIESFEKYFAVKVTKKVESKLSNRKVSPKTDVYIVEAQISDLLLLEQDYILTEDTLSDMKIEYKIVNNSGISVKIKSSEQYTIQKLTVNSFLKVFSEVVEDINEVLFSLLLYSDPKQQVKNYEIAANLGIDYKMFMKNNNLDYSCINKKELNSVREKAQKKVVKAIKENKEIWESIFTGKHWFTDPYYASFLYSHEKLKSNQLGDFYITTGSGRSKGKYTIEIKPKM